MITYEEDNTTNSVTGDEQLVRLLQDEMEQSNLKITRLEAEKKLLENSTPKKLPSARREGLFGLGGYHCKNCDKKTNRYGRWTCNNCGYQQINKW